VREHGCGPIQENHDRVPAADLKEIAGEEVKYSYGANTLAVNRSRQEGDYKRRGPGLLRSEAVQ